MFFSIFLPELFIFQWNHDKVYRSFLEERMRFSIFQKNLKIINEHNRKFYSGNTRFKLGINHFADTLPSELEKRMSSLKLPQMPGGYNYAPPDSIKTPTTMDWRVYGAVSEVRNQKKCGACWAFATVRKL